MKKRKKLNLRRETLIDLHANVLDRAVGGGFTMTCYTDACPSQDCVSNGCGPPPPPSVPCPSPLSEVICGP